MSAGGPPQESITVRFPAELPVLSRESYRIILEILIELTTVEVLDGPLGGGGHDY
jgi:hypothetical protein